MKSALPLFGLFVVALFVAQAAGQSSTQPPAGTMIARGKVDLPYEVYDWLGAQSFGLSVGQLTSPQVSVNEDLYGFWVDFSSVPQDAGWVAESKVQGYLNSPPIVEYWGSGYALNLETNERRYFTDQHLGDCEGDGGQTTESVALDALHRIRQDYSILPGFLERNDESPYNWYTSICGFFSKIPPVQYADQDKNYWCEIRFTVEKGFVGARNFDPSHKQKIWLYYDARPYYTPSGRPFYVSAFDPHYSLDDLCPPS
ncbi:MAG: hypothetical protein ACPGQL_08425 [Thermoplasmatota archaeon]